MADVDWKCLIIHAVVTVVTFLVVVRFWLYAKKDNGEQPQIKIDDFTLYGAALLSFLVGYLVIIFMKLDCLNYPTDTKEETNRKKENFTSNFGQMRERERREQERREQERREQERRERERERERRVEELIREQEMMRNER